MKRSHAGNTDLKPMLNLNVVLATNRSAQVKKFILRSCKRSHERKPGSNGDGESLVRRSSEQLYAACVERKYVFDDEVRCDYVPEKIKSRRKLPRSELRAMRRRRHGVRRVGNEAKGGDEERGTRLSGEAKVERKWNFNCNTSLIVLSELRA
ncbi:hypothetical protein EVAR_7888_1 [Eumeta japonica]|uniref:Uncharacterized protein n=1 Tax=Eumeta variegata TaxID=151549 RepID=A0A4C1TV43_EUMVA|nr:hypothetical protein EVAR_7888_1 [Eumeta japonica]